MNSESMNRKLKHICESCGKTEILTPEEAYDEGWDYPPKMGAFTVISPRTCGSCPITETLWWRVSTVADYELTEADRSLIDRIMDEPYSVWVE